MELPGARPSTFRRIARNSFWFIGMWVVLLAAWVVKAVAKGVFVGWVRDSLAQQGAKAVIAQIVDLLASNPIYITLVPLLAYLGYGVREVLIENRVRAALRRFDLRFEIQRGRSLFGFFFTEGSITERVPYLHARIWIRFENSGQRQVEVVDYDLGIIEKRRWRRPRALPTGGLSAHRLQRSNGEDVYPLVVQHGRATSDLALEFWVMLVRGTPEQLRNGHHFVRVTVKAVGQEPLSDRIWVDWNDARRRGMLLPLA
ncbi:MAG: hypothetical protein ACHQ4J_08120 [Candidatus Binatia bacterium]